MTAVLILLFLLLPLLTFALLVVGPLCASVRLRRAGWGWLISLVPTLVACVVLASEIYPLWLVRKIAKQPLVEEPHQTVQSVYAYNGYAPEAVRLIVKFPSLQFTEALIDQREQNDRSIFHWYRMPLGPVRFAGRRLVKKAEDCDESEVSVPIGRGIGWGTDWYCTKWAPAGHVGSSYEVGFRTFDYQVGRYKVFEREDSVFNRSDKRLRNRIVMATVTGGIWWHLTEWLGDATGLSGLANGNTIGPYGASTATHLKTHDAEQFLITGKP